MYNKLLFTYLLTYNVAVCEPEFTRLAPMEEMYSASLFTCSRLISAHSDKKTLDFTVNVYKMMCIKLGAIFFLDHSVYMCCIVQYVSCDVSVRADHHDDWAGAAAVGDGLILSQR